MGQPRDITNTDMAKVMFEQGATPQQVADLLGITRQRAYVIRWRMQHPDYHREQMAKWRLSAPLKYFGMLDKMARKRKAKRPRGPNKRARRAFLRKSIEVRNDPA